MNSEEKVTFDELVKYAKRSALGMQNANGMISPEDSAILRKVDAAAKKDPDIADIIIRIQRADNELVIDQLRGNFDRLQQEKFNKLSEEEKISETYGISLDNIEHIRLRSGEEYYKFYDARTNRDLILSQNNKDKNLSEEFQEVQNGISGAHSEDALQNGEDIFKYQRMHTNNEVHLYAIEEIENNPLLLGDLDVEQLKALSTLLKNKEKLKIKYINPDTGLAIDEEHKVITAELDKNKEKYEIMYPQEYGYTSAEDSKEGPSVSDDPNQSEVIDANSEGKSIIETFFSDTVDEPVENEEITDPDEIDEELVDPERVRMYYEYPEMLDRDTTLTEEERNRYLKAVEKHNEEVEKERSLDDPPKVLVKTKPTSSQGFASALLLALFAGYVAGIITLIMFRIINHI